LQCPVTDLADGTGRYQANCPGVKEQGNYELRLYHCFQGGLMGQYYYDAYFHNLAVSRLDRQVNYTWGTGKLTTHATDYVSIRWTGVLKPQVTDSYLFYVDADEQARLWVDGNLLIDHWQESYTNLDPPRAVRLTGGWLYEVVLEYRELRGEAHCRLMWKRASQANTNVTVIASNFLYALFPIGDGTPVNVSIVSAPTAAAATECTGQGLVSGTALQESTFQVCPRDSFLNMRDDTDESELANEYFSARKYRGVVWA